jgi:hypothetical protein
LNNAVVSAGGIEAGAGARRDRLNFGGERCQLGQQFGIGNAMPELFLIGHA